MNKNAAETIGSFPCIISGQRANLIRFGKAGVGDCLTHCQICRVVEGRAVVKNGVVVECFDGETFHNENLAVDKAVSGVTA